MDCITAHKLVTPYIKRELDTREVEDFIDHIKTCKECYEELEIYFTIHFALQQLDEEESQSYDISKLLRENLKTTEQKINKDRRRQIYGFAIVALTQAAIILTLVTQLQLWNFGSIEGTSVYQMHPRSSNNIQMVTPGDIIDGPQRESQILDNSNINNIEEVPSDVRKKLLEEKSEDKIRDSSK